jgi:DNA-binding CsgD family transcriptional regulator/tetratricopeptide (TPR) repeat protein
VVSTGTATTGLHIASGPGIMASVAHASRTLIGRDAELAALTSLVGVGAPTRERRHVLLAGDAGVGKTRLLQELAEQARAAGWQVYPGHCLDLGDSALSYLPFSEVIDRVADEHAAVVEDVARAYPDLARLQPVRRLLGAADRPFDGADRAQLFEGVQALLEALAAGTPTLLVVEDAHWADQSTRDLLTFLFTRPLPTTLAVVASYRSDDLHRRHPLRRQVAEWSRLGSVERITVGPLDDEDVRTLVGELDPGATEQEKAAIVARAEGNAFFVEELVGAASGPDHWVPDELADVLLVRLDRLDETARDVVRTASVAGRKVTHALLAEVTDLADDELDEALRHAVESHVLVSGEGDYSFRHALLGEAVYDDLLPGQRVRLHGRYADALASGRARGTAAELARHARLAQDFDTALAAAIRAGDEAMAVGGPNEATMYYERSLQLLEDPQRTMPEGDSEVRVVEATVNALLGAGQTARAARVARDQRERMVDAAPADRARLLTAEAVALGLLDVADADPLPVSEEAIASLQGADPALRARVLANHTQILYWRDRREEAETWGLEALAIAERHNLPQIASAVVTTLSSLGRRNDPTTFRRAVQAAIDRAVVSGAIASEMQGRYILARSHQDWGEWAPAEASFRAVVELAERTGRPWAPYAFESRHQLAWILYVVGRWDDALALLAPARPGAPAVPYAVLDSVRQTIRQGRGESVPRRLHRAEWEGDGVVTVFCAGPEIRAAATCEEAVGVYDEAVTLLSRLWTPWFPGRVRLAATVLGRLAELLPELPAGARPARAELATRLLDEATATRERYDGSDWGPEGRAWMQRAQAETLRVRWLAGTDAPAAADLVAAWREAERLFADFGHVEELARVRVVLATLLRTTGSSAAARETAELARQAALALGARPLLSALDETVGAVSTTLTSREAEVLALVAEGRTNGEIGKRLFISTKTVSVHVSNILAKLGAGGRTEAVAIARREGLLE